MTDLPPGVASVRRSSLQLVLKVARDPLSAIPAQIYASRMVLGRNLGRLIAYVADPALIHEALVKNADHLAKSDDMKRVLGTALGEGLLTADGPTWRWQRQALAPAFQHDRLTSFPPKMIAAAEATRDRWLALSTDGVVDLGHEMMQTTFQIIVDTMLAGPGFDAAKVERSLSDYLKATPWMFAMALLGLPYGLPFPGKSRVKASIRFMRGVIRERIAARRAHDPAEADLIGMLLAASDPETGRTLDDEAITDNILTFIAAGHETTALALSWTFALLARHPDSAERLRREIDTVTGGNPIKPSDLGALVFARQIVSEAMRLYPPAPTIARSVERDTEIGGVALPAGSVIIIPIYAVHRHNDLWVKPEAFDPDRFAPDAAKARQRFAYMPFGAGPRTCIGNGFAMMEAVAILAVLAQAVTLEAVDAELPGHRMQVTLRPRSPLRMRVRARRA